MYQKFIKLLICGVLIGSNSIGNAATVHGNPIQWQPMTLDVGGPASDETDVMPNPFLDRRLTVTFTSPTGQNYQVPGYFAGNGLGYGAGSIWRARFTPDQAGQWQYQIDFVEGNNIAINDEAGTPLAEHGQSASFEVAVRDLNAAGFLRDGPLEYVGNHYLKQADGDYWIKGGIDSPENFFGYAGFDNTIDQSGGVGTGSMLDGVHRYAAHEQHWRDIDPNFISADTGVDGKGIIGAVNYLADQGVNSIYFLTMNLGGDGRETYPFIGTSGSHFDNTHFDISKLYQWNIVLNHMQTRAIAAHIVLGEQEIDNSEWLDGGELGIERKLYYRELIARFSYLHGIKWNLSEESRYGHDRHRQFADYLRTLDWAAHPIAVHSWIDNPALAYDSLLGNSDFDATSIQYSPENAEVFVETWRRKSRDAGWPWVIDMDEIGPAATGLTDSNADELRRSVLYPVYFSGGNIEWYFGYHGLPLGGDLRTEDFSTREPMYRYMRYARSFMQRYLPFWEMQADDQRLAGGNDNDQVFATQNAEATGSAYAVYLNDGNSGRQLSVVDGSYQQAWYNPRNGLFIGKPRSVSGSSIELGGAPVDVDQDWVVLIKYVEPVPDTEAGTEPVTASVPDTPASPGTATPGDIAAENPADTLSGNPADNPAEMAVAIPVLTDIPELLTVTAAQPDATTGVEPATAAATGTNASDASGPTIAAAQPVVTGGSSGPAWLLLLIAITYRQQTLRRHPRRVALAAL